MPFFDFLKRKPKIKGKLGYFALVDWWLSTFTMEERDYIESVYQPMSIGVGGSNTRPLTVGEIGSTNETAVNLLSGLAGWFKKPDDLHIARRILNKAEQIGSSDPLDLHYLYQEMIGIYYRSRDTDLNALSDAISVCQKQIDIAPKAGKQLKSQYTAQEAQRTFGARLPAHVGYKQLAIIHEKEKNYAEAIRLSKQAKKQGWNGDWDKRITRCEGKIGTQRGSE